MDWPYPIKYDVETDLAAQVLVLGGGIAGCWAAIAATRMGAEVLLVEKSATIKSGAGGAGCDHWQHVTESPFCLLGAGDLAQALVDNHKGYNNGIGRYIQCRDGYETLLELEQMGAKVRDTEGEFAGAAFRDEETGFLYTYDYVNKYTLRVWGTTFKRALHRELRRLGVRVLDRVMVTGLPTDDRGPARRVVGATGVHTRTGEFFVCRAPATVLGLSYPGRQWIFNTELGGLASFPPPTNAGDGHAMAWEAGAEMVMLERSVSGMNGTDGGNAVPAYMMGTFANTWYPCSLVDAAGREVPWVDKNGRRLASVAERCRPAEGQQFFLSGGGVTAPPHPGVGPWEAPHPQTKELLDAGEISLPLYADLPGMPDEERRVIFGLMVGQEAKTNIPVLETLKKAGFDPARDQLQSYHGLGLSDWLRPNVPACWRRAGFNPGGPWVDWNLETSLKGLYAAGDQIFGGNDHSHAATTGRWAGRHAALAALASPAVASPDRSQIDRAKARVYAPVKRSGGMHWKEFNAGLCKVMQDYCGGIKSQALLELGLQTFAEIREREANEVHAANPKELMRTLEAFSILSVGEATMQACLARRASAETLHFFRSDYPEVDPPAWNKFVTVTKTEAGVRPGEHPFGYWLPFEENYLKHKIEPSS